MTITKQIIDGTRIKMYVPIVKEQSLGCNLWEDESNLTEFSDPVKWIDLFRKT